MKKLMIVVACMVAHLFREHVNALSKRNAAVLKTKQQWIDDPTLTDSTVEPRFDTLIEMTENDIATHQELLDVLVDVLEKEGVDLTDDALASFKTWMK